MIEHPILVGVAAGVVARAAAAAIRRYRGARRTPSNVVHLNPRRRNRT